MEITDITEAIEAGRLRITEHAYDEASNDGLSLEEIISSVLRGEIIEDYPADRPYPSCLVFGRSVRDDPIHSVWAYNETTRWTVLITVYRPDPNRWIDYRERKSPDEAF